MAYGERGRERAQVVGLAADGRAFLIPPALRTYSNVTFVVNKCSTRDQITYLIEFMTEPVPLLGMMRMESTLAPLATHVKDPLIVKT